MREAPYFLSNADCAAADAICAPRVTVRAIVQEVAARTGCDVQDILGRSREQRIARARQLVCYVARMNGMSFPKIARELNRDHTTIIAAVNAERQRRTLGTDNQELVVQVGPYRREGQGGGCTDGHPVMPFS